MSEELKPCPFCGDMPTFWNAREDVLLCPCLAGPEVHGTSRENAIAAWNRRAIPATDAREAAQAQARAAWRIAGMVTNNDEALRVHEAICALFNIGTEPPEGIDEART